jgi:hypothetical protein
VRYGEITAFRTESEDAAIILCNGCFEKRSILPSQSTRVKQGKESPLVSSSIEEQSLLKDLLPYLSAKESVLTAAKLMESQHKTAVLYSLTHSHLLCWYFHDKRFGFACDVLV